MWLESAEGEERKTFHFNLMTKPFEIQTQNIKHISFRFARKVNPRKCKINHPMTLWESRENPFPQPNDKLKDEMKTRKTSKCIYFHMRITCALISPFACKSLMENDAVTIMKEEMFLRSHFVKYLLLKSYTTSCRFWAAESLRYSSQIQGSSRKLKGITKSVQIIREMRWAEIVWANIENIFS